MVQVVIAYDLPAEGRTPQMVMAKTRLLSIGCGSNAAETLGKIGLCYYCTVFINGCGSCAFIFIFIYNLTLLNVWKRIE